MRPTWLLSLVLGCVVLFAAACDDDEPTDALTDTGGGDAGDTNVGIDVDPNAEPVTARFEVDGEGFFRTPWPFDYRTDAGGHPVLDDFPNASNQFVARYVTGLQEAIVGFGTMPVVYLAFDTAFADGILPAPSETLDASGPVQLLDVSPEGCGQRVPVEVRFIAEGDDYRDDNMLMASPVPGFSLAATRPYALVVLRSLGAGAGQQAAVAPPVAEALADSSADARLNEVFAPLRDCLEGAGLSADDIAVATVFTTQDPVTELRLMHDQVLDVERTAAPEVTDWAQSEDASRPGRYLSYTGWYSTPIFQAGTSPYNTGGGVVLDDDGEPVVQRWEDVPFVVSFPTREEPPFAVMVWEDGTGADLLDNVDSEPMLEAINAGFAIVTFMPQFHGQRAVAGSSPELSTFNFLNPVAGRTVFRQQVVDTAYFVRLVREVLPGLEGMPELDTDQLVYGGHSQGAIAGGILAGVDDQFEAFSLNGIGAYLSITIVERTDPVDINAQIAALLRIDEELDRYHPIVALAQLGGEATDPINYARYWRGWEGHPDGASLFLSNGRLDHTTPQTSVNAMTISGSLTPVDGVGWDPDPFEVWSMEPLPLPIQGNTQSLSGDALTIVTYLSSNTGHYTIYDRSDIRIMSVGFLQSALQGVPVVE